LVSTSSKRILEEAEGGGRLEVVVICDECGEAKGLAQTEQFSAGQVEEAEKISKRVELEMRRN
jgi:RNase P subunit RPR2